MQVFKVDQKRIRRQRLLIVSQLVVGTLTFVTAMSGIGYRLRNGWDTPAGIVSDSWFSLLTMLGFVAAFAGVVLFARGHRGKLRVVITQNTLATKARLKPIVFIHKRDCIAFGPIRGIFTFWDGSEYALADLNIPVRDGYALKAFVLDYWWPELGREQIEAALEQELPSPRHRIWLLFTTIFVS